MISCYENFAHASILMISWKLFQMVQIFSAMVGEALVAKSNT
jgi:hypothetical protein